MSLATVAFATVFLVSMAAFAIGIAWKSIREETHSPAALRSDSDASG